jgi:hypothetical protein
MNGLRYILRKEVRYMKYDSAQKVANDLRELAQFLEDHGHELPGEVYFPSSYNHLYDDYDGGRTAKQKAKQAAKVLAKGALVEKKHDNYSLDMIRRFGDIRLIFSINREKFCTKKVVDVKHIEERVIAAHTEEVIEWVCDDPVLAG